MDPSPDSPRGHLQAVAYLRYGDPVSLGEQHKERNTFIPHSRPIAFVLGFVHWSRLDRFHLTSPFVTTIIGASCVRIYCQEAAPARRLSCFDKAD